MSVGCSIHRNNYSLSLLWGRREKGYLFPAGRPNPTNQPHPHVALWSDCPPLDYSSIKNKIKRGKMSTAVFFSKSLVDTGVLPLISTSFGPRRSGNGSQTHGILQHWLFGSQSLVQTEAFTQMGSRNCPGMGDSSSGSPEGLRCSPLLCGWKLFF